MPTDSAQSKEKKVSKADAIVAFKKLQTTMGLFFFLSAGSGVYLLATDQSLWRLAVSHAYGLIAVVIIDVIAGILNIRDVRKAYLPSTIWAILTILLQIGDITTASQYGMTPLYFATYLFTLPAFDVLLAAQFFIVGIGLVGRSYVSMLTKKKVTYFTMGIDNSRRDFLQIASSIGILVALAGVLGLAENVYGGTPAGSPTTQSSNLPSGAIANINDLQVDSPITFYYPSANNPNMLVKKSNGTLVALSLLCTHICCECSYYQPANQIQCPCHGSLFNGTDGSVIRGPAATSLPSIKLNVDSGGNIFPVAVNGSSPCLG